MKPLIALACLSFYQLCAGNYGLPSYLILPASLLAGFSLLFAVADISTNRSSSYFCLSLFICSFLVHFRPELFYLADELTVLNRFEMLGTASFRYAHNEHFLPLYWVYFYSLTSFVELNYWIALVVSSLLHALNALILANILNTILKRLMSDAPAVSRFIAFLFLASALHAETMHWAFEHCVLISALLTLVSIRLGIKYVESGCPKDLAYSAIACMLTPLFFGNGFASIFQVTFFCGLYLLGGGSLKRLAYLGLFCGLTLSLTAGLYLANREHSEGRKISQLSLNVKEPVKYAVLGSQLGAVFRGLGLYPGLEFGSARALFGKEGNVQTLEFRNKLDPEVIATGLGVLISLSLLLLLWRFFGKKGLLYWGLSQGLIVSGLLLPAIARWPLGLGQSLAMRYYYIGIIGTLILLTPLVFYALTGKHRFALALLGIHLSLQLYHGAEFSYYTSRGTENRKFVAEVLADQEPPIPEIFAPGLNHERIRKILQWLTRT